MADVFQTMFPNDIYEMYNERLIADQYFVDTIVASINFQIYYYIQEGSEYFFLYDAMEWLENQPHIQILRIIDQVILHFRSRGIRCYIDNTYKFNADTTEIPGSQFNYPSSTATILRVEWYIRQGQEFMKAYL